MNRRHAVALAKLVVSAGLVAALLQRIGWPALGAALGGARSGWLLAALGVMLASNLLGSLQWRVLLRLAGVELPGRRVVAFYLVGIFFNNFLPSSVGGDASRIIDAGRASGRRAAAVGATLVDRLLGMSVIALLAAAAAWRGRGLLAGQAGSQWVLGGVALLLLASGGGLGMLLSRRLSRLVGRLVAALPAVAAGPGGRLMAALEPLRAARGAALRLLLLSVAVQGLRIATHMLVARALDIELEVGYFLLFVPLLAALVMLPISINGIGVRESMGAVLFGFAGVAPAAASAMQFLAYLVAVLASLVGGVIFLVRRPVRQPLRRDLEPR